ncbi:MAG: translocation/assembly module TamB domain-containing protein [Oligoflexales bacterium]
MNLLKKIIGFLLFVILLLGVPAAVLVLYPEAVINNRTFALLPKLLKRWDLVLNYETADITAQSLSLREKKFDFKLVNACLTKDKEFALCAGQLQVSAGIDLLGNPVVIKTLGPITVDNGLAKFWQTGPKKEDEEPESFDFASIRQHVIHTDIQPIVIQDLKLLMEGPETERAAIINATTNVLAEDTLEFVTQISGVKNWPLTNFDLRALLKHHPDQVDLSLNTAGRLPSKGGSFAARVEANVTPERIAAKLSGNLSRIAESIEKVETTTCSIQANMARQNVADISIRDCPFMVQRNLFERERSFPAAPPVRVSGTLVGDYSLLEDNFEIAHSRTTFSIDPIKTTLYSITGSAHLDMHGKMLSEADRTINFIVDSQIKLPKFERIVRKFRRTAWAIPAPLNTLSGDVSCTLQGAVDITKGTSRIPYRCASNLIGADQRLRMQANGTFDLQWLAEGIRPHIESIIDLQNVSLVLPTIEFQKGLPSVRPDPRFISESIAEHKLKQENEPRRFPLSYSIRIKTTGNPLRVKATSFKTTLQAYMDLFLSNNEGMSGFLKMTKFTVKVIKKAITIEYANFMFFRNKPTQVDALATIEKSDMTLKLAVLGPVKKPEISFTSDPPRPESELISQMLYGGDTGGLNSNQQRTVGQTRAALADNAIGLISMLYLASTPVESVGYNPHSGEFHAQVRVREGTTLKIGSDFESSQTLGITRALGGNWSFETSAVSEHGESRTRGIAMLRWAKRY